MAEVMQRYYKGKSFETAQYRLRLPSEFPTRRYTASVKKPNPYTMQEMTLEREELPEETEWTGYEKRPGMTDLRPIILERDWYTCQLCDESVTTETAGWITSKQSEGSSDR
jgi:hypothetical protein